MNIQATNTKVVTGLVRFSYVHAFTPWAGDANQDPKYSVCILIPKSDTTTLKAIKSAIEAAKLNGKSKLADKNGRFPMNLKLPLRDGDAERPDQPEYVGNYFLNASSKQKPGIVDNRRQEILDQTEFYSGCYGRASLNFYAFAVNGNKGVAVGLNNLQKLKDGEPLGGVRSRAEDDFTDVEMEDDFLS